MSRSAAQVRLVKVAGRAALELQKKGSGISQTFYLKNKALWADANL